jgi:hypothetical protein
MRARSIVRNTRSDQEINICTDADPRDGARDSPAFSQDSHCYF